MKYIIRNSITGFLLSLMVAYFIRLWALEHGHKLLSTLATVYMFALLLPAAIALLVLIFAGIFLLFMIFGRKKRGYKPFWFKNKTWTR